MAGVDLPEYKRLIARMVSRAHDTPRVLHWGVPVYSCTLGNYPRYGVEFIAFNIDPTWAHLVFGDIRVSLDMEGPQVLRFDEPTSKWTTAPTKYMVCEQALAAKYASPIYAKYGYKVHLIQIVFPDNYGRFPEDPGYTSPNNRTQPLLYR